MNLTPVGIDIAKSVFQLHYVDAETGEIVNRPIKRARFLEHFANRAPCLIGMEACGGAQHWARELIKMGHQVKLMPAEFAKAFNIRNKNDAADARAVWLAVQQPGKAVAIKTEAQQAVLALHRMRQQLVKFPYDADQQPARTVDRIRRSDGQGPGCARQGNTRGAGQDIGSPAYGVD